MTKNRGKKAVIGLLLVAGISTLAFQEADIYFLIKKNFTIFSETYEEVALEYVDQVDPETLMRNGLVAMLETLDPYTVFYDEKQNEQAEIFSRSNYAGVGIEAGYRNGEVVVIAPTEGGPAEKKGIRAGDVIVAIDGVSTEGLQPDEVQNLTMGEIGSVITFTIRRFGVEQPLTFELTRENIEVPNVTFSGRTGPDEAYGYIRLAQFGMNAADEIRSSYEDLRLEGEIAGLILDLRDNPGGILQEAVAIIDKFVEPGLQVVETRGRIAEYNESYETREPVLFDGPLVILMNGGSASASEVVAGALQDLDRAVIIGEQSFGKGLVQIVKPMPYNTSLKITISRYYTPSGRSIQSVNYTHEARNSSVSNSERQGRVFETRNGRPVNEGRGIEPDVITENKLPGLLEVALRQQGAYFDYATKFESENQDFSAEELPDAVYADFIAFTDEISLNYLSDEENLLAELSASVSGPAANEHIEALRTIIRENKRKAFQDFEDSIRKELFLELISRYRDQKTAREAALALDTDMKEALDLLTAPDILNGILEGQR